MLIQLKEPEVSWQKYCHSLLENTIHICLFVCFAGSPAYDSVRSLAYNEADVFLVCYKISDPSSLYNVKAKWVPEIRASASTRVPVILCGLQADTRDDPEVIGQLSKRGRAPVNSEQALAICCEVGAANYVETSALDLDLDVCEAFEVSALAAIKLRACRSAGSLLSGRSAGFGTHSSSGSAQKRSISDLFGTTSSKKSNGSGSIRLNVSFDNSGGPAGAPVNAASEFSMALVAQPQHPPTSPRGEVIFEDEDDIFPASESMSPHQNRKSFYQNVRSSFSSASCAPAPAPAPARNESSVPVNASLAQLVERPAQLNHSASTPAQIRSNGLSRRASFRSPTTAAVIPVASPKSPLGPPEIEISGSLGLENSGACEPTYQNHHVSSASNKDDLKLKAKAYESLKSQGSTGSTGSKSSGSGSSSNAGSSSRNGTTGSMDILDPSVPDTEDPELLGRLQFVSPKAGVFRPVGKNSGAGSGSNSSPLGLGKSSSLRLKDKEKCVVM